jgi:hypothetical protein
VFDTGHGSAIILALGRLRQKNFEFKTSLGYTVRSCLEGEKKRKLQVQGPEFKP